MPHSTWFAPRRRKLNDPDKTIRTLDDQCADIYRQHPFYEPPDLVQMLRRLIESPDFRRATNLP